VVDPKEVIKKYGVDVLRLWVASVDYERDVVISDELLKNTAEVYRKIRNTCRFLLGSLFDLRTADNEISYSKLRMLDRFALHEALKVNSQAQAMFEVYNFSGIVQLLGRYCASDLSAFYLDMVKDRLYVGGAAERGSAQMVLRTILQILSRLIAPILPHTAEDVHDAIPYAKEGHSVHLYQFYNEEQAVPAINEAHWSVLKDMRSHVLKAIEQLRAAGTLKHSLEARVTLHIDPSSEAGKAYSVFATELTAAGEDEVLFMKEWCIVSQVVFADSAADVQSSDLNGLSIGVEPAHGIKCPRCWHWSESKHEDGLCARCESVLVSK
jgi:isoleucyl-tRNA synthetase